MDNGPRIAEPRPIHGRNGANNTRAAAPGRTPSGQIKTTRAGHSVECPAPPFRQQIDGYFSISSMLRRIKFVKFSPLSIPFDSKARSITCLTSLFSLPISVRRAVRSPRSLSTLAEDSSRDFFSSSVSWSGFLSLSFSSMAFCSDKAASSFLFIVFRRSP